MQQVPQGGSLFEHARLVDRQHRIPDRHAPQNEGQASTPAAYGPSSASGGRGFMTGWVAVQPMIVCGVGLPSMRQHELAPGFPGAAETSHFWTEFGSGQRQPASASLPAGHWVSR